MKPIFNRMSLIGLIAILAIAANSCSSERTQVIKLAHGLDQTHPVHKAMVFMADRLKEKSKGELQIQIYSGGQLGSERGTLELLQIGSIGITKVSSAVLEGFVEDYKILGLPYLFKSREHAFSVLDGKIGQKILLSGEDIWLRGLCFYDAGFRSFYTKTKLVNSPDDLKGLKVRVMKSIMAINMIKSLGGSPTPISWGELYTALQSGVVDAAENNPPSFYLSRHYEVCKYYSLDEHTAVPDVLLISTVIWNDLSEQEKQWMQEAVDESVVYQRKLWAESERDALEKVKQAGVEIGYPDKTEFAKMVQPLYDKLISDPRLLEIVNEIKSDKSLKNTKHEKKN